MSDLALTSSVRQKPGRIPLPHLVTAAGWLLVAGLFAAYAWLFGRTELDTRLTGLVGAILCATTAIGLAPRNKFARLAAIALSVLIAVPALVLSLAAFYPFELFWWPGVVLIGFCAWTLFFAIGLWPDYVAPKSVAA